MHYSAENNGALDAIRTAVNTAERRFEVIDGGKRNGGGGGPPQEGADAMPCPVAVIGHLDGDFYFLDRVGQMRVLKASQMTRRADLVSLFGGDISWLKDKFPKTTKVKEKGQDGEETSRDVVVDFKINHVAEFLQRECFKAGLYGDHIQIRRPGIWPGAGGMPVVHCGDRVLIGSKLERPGTRIGNQIWAAAPAEARPGDPCSVGVARALQSEIAGLWNFRVPGGDIIVMGMLGCAYYGAAIPWRPAGFLTGSAGCGKSSLLEVLKAASPLKYATNDTSKAGLEQSVDGRAMPMFVDEASDRVDQRGARAMLDMVLSATGGEGTKGARGGSDGKARKIEVAGSIIMASISPPDMQAQHLGRFTLVELKPPSVGADHTAEHRELAQTARDMGPGLWARALAGWERYRESRLVLRAAVGRAHCVPREMDQLGGLLAGWWTLTNDHVPSDKEADNAVRGIEGFIKGQEQTATQDAPQQMVDYLMSQLVQVQRSTDKRSISSLIATILSKDCAPDPNDDTLSGEVSKVIAAAALAQFGIRVVREDEPKSRQGRPAPRLSDGAGIWVWPGNSMLTSLFTNTTFEGQKWQYLMLRLESAKTGKDPVRIAKGSTHRNCIWVRAVELGLSDDDLEDN